MKKHLLWDLDGTLTDPRAGIIRCFQYALKEMGHPVPAEEALLWVIGPPLQESFPTAVPGITEIETWAMIEKYRERFGELGMFENEVYPEIPGLLHSLKDRRHFVATSKPRYFAEKIIDHYGLADCFERTHGAELNGVRSDKGELIRYILESEQIPAGDAVMIGDRKHDIIGAKKAGVTAIGITWGYGSRAEHELAGADHIFDTPAELRAFLQA